MKISSSSFVTAQTLNICCTPQNLKIASFVDNLAEFILELRGTTQESRMPKVYSKRVELKQATYDDLVAMRARLKEIIDSAKTLRSSTKTQLEEWRKERSAIAAWVKRNEAEIEAATPKDAETISTYGSLEESRPSTPLSFVEQHGLTNFIPRAPGDYTPEGYVDDDDT